MPPKRQHIIAQKQQGSASAMPTKKNKNPTTSLSSQPTIPFNANVSTNFPVNSYPNTSIRLPFKKPRSNSDFNTMRDQSLFEDEDEDEDDLDYHGSGNMDESDSESDDDSMECDQYKDWGSDDELGHEAQVHVIDESGHPARRGITRLKNIWNLPKGERVSIEVNKNFQVVGENSSLFSRFLGTMARRGDYCPLNYLTWPKVPKEYKKHCLTTISSKFVLKCNNDDPMVLKCWARYSLSCLGRRWRDFRKQLKDKFFDVSKTKEQMVVGIPHSVDPLQMKCLIDYWMSSDGKSKSARNKISRTFQKDVHTLGSKTYARLAHELEIRDGRAQTRSDLYIQSRKRKNGEPVTDIAAENIKQMETLLSQQEVDPSQGLHGQIVYAPGDVYSQVIAKEERNGRIRGIGFGPTTSHTRSTDKSSYYDLIEQHMQDVNTIKTLQEQLLEKESERLTNQKQLEEQMSMMAEQIKLLSQILPGVQINGAQRLEVSPGLQQKSSCASVEEGEKHENH